MTNQELVYKSFMFLVESIEYLGNQLSNYISDQPSI